MAGARKKPSKKGGNYQGYYRDYAGKRIFFVGTSDRRETIDIAKGLENKHRKIALGHDPKPSTPAKYRKRPFLEAVEEYLRWGLVFGRKDGKGWTPEWAKRNQDYLLKWAETLTISTLADLDDIQIRVEAVLTQFAEQGFTGRGRSGRVKPLRAFITWSIGHGYLINDPLEGLGPIDETAETERRALDEVDIAKIFSVAPAWRQLLYGVAICTGLRASELRRLDRTDLEVQNDRLRLRWKKTKNRKAAYCYLPHKVVEQLVVFADSGTPARLYEKARTRKALPDSPILFVPTHAVRLLYRDMEKVGVPRETVEGKVDFHALRVASITMADEQGATPKELQEHARHSDPKLTFNVYAKKHDRQRAALAERIGAALPDFKSAVDVHFGTDGVPGDARKSLPAQDVSLSGSGRGPCPTDAGPILYPRLMVPSQLRRFSFDRAGAMQYG